MKSIVVLFFCTCISLTSCSDDECPARYKLVSPCDESIVVEDCEMFRMVSDQGVLPPRPEYPTNTRCTLKADGCGFACEERLDPDRPSYLVCYQDGEPVAHASVRFPIYEDGEKVHLLFVEIDGFTRTTNLDSGTCSNLAQDGGRFGHTATRLQDGRVLIAGGIRRIGQVEEILATAEIYDPATGVHRLIVGPEGRPLHMATERAFHTATLLRDGNVLITGGVGLVQNKWASLRSSEIFDVKAETFPADLIGITNEARASHTSTMLTTSGNVLVAGGAIYDAQNIVTYHDSAEVYIPATNVWTPVNNTMTFPRAFHTATELDPAADRGKVIVIGGMDSTGPYNTVEMYDPEGNQFYPHPDPEMMVNRSNHCAVLLENGNVLVAGGTTTGQIQDATAGVEIYDSALGGAFGGFHQMALNLSTARLEHTCTRLHNGDVLVAGGLTADVTVTGAGEIVLVNQGVYAVHALEDQVDPPRYLHTATSLSGGLVFLAGGLRSVAPDAQAIAQSLLFAPMPDGL